MAFHIKPVNALIVCSDSTSTRELPAPELPKTHLRTREDILTPRDVNIRRTPVISRPFSQMANPRGAPLSQTDSVSGTSSDGRSSSMPCRMTSTHSPPGIPAKKLPAALSADKKKPESNEQVSEKRKTCSFTYYLHSQKTTERTHNRSLLRQHFYCRTRSRIPLARF